jgi:hypothetical protein
MRVSMSRKGDCLNDKVWRGCGDIKQGSFQKETATTKSEWEGFYVIGRLRPMWRITKRLASFKRPMKKRNLMLKMLNKSLRAQ